MVYIIEQKDEETNKWLDIGLTFSTYEEAKDKVFALLDEKPDGKFVIIKK